MPALRLCESAESAQATGGAATPGTAPATLCQWRDSWSGAVITEINGAAAAVLGVGHLGPAYGGSPFAPHAQRTNASGPLPLCVA